MNRDEWKFEYSGKVLYAASMRKYRTHASRIKWWKERKVGVMTEIKKRGLTVDQTQAALYGSVSNNANFVGKARDQRAVIVVDERLQQKLDECATKIAHHAAMTAGYDAWCQVLRAHPKQTFQLHQDDYLYFFGK